MLMPCSAYTQQCTGESRRYGRPPATGPPPRAALPLLRWRGRCAPRHTLPPPGPEPRSPSRRAGAPHPAWPGTPATSRRCESRRSALPSSACPAAPPAPPYGQGGSVHSSGPSLQRASRPCQTTRTPRPLSVLFLAPFPLAPPPPPRAACIAPPPPRAACEPLETTPLLWSPCIRAYRVCSLSSASSFSCSRRCRMAASASAPSSSFFFLKSELTALLRLLPPRAPLRGTGVKRGGRSGWGGLEQAGWGGRAGGARAG